MSSESLDKVLNEKGNEVSVRGDAYGRQFSNDFYLRGILVSASVALNTGLASVNETTVLAADSANLLDLVYVSASNSSTSAVSISIRGGTAGAIVESLNIPAGSATSLGTNSRNYWPAFPANDINQPWTVQIFGGGEISATDAPVKVTMMAIKNPFPGV